MKSLAIIAALGLLAAPVWAGEAQTYDNVPLVCNHCHLKVKDHPDSHERSCAIECASSGYGVYLEDGTWLKLDEKGNELALDALRASDKTDTIRATVTGERDGDTLNVTELELK